MGLIMKNLKISIIDDNERRLRERRDSYDRRNYIRFAPGEQLNDRRYYFDRRDKKDLFELEII